MADIKKIVEALKMIKDECYSYTCGTGPCEVCVDCPLYSGSANECAIIKSSPDNWDIIVPVVRVMK